MLRALVMLFVTLIALISLERTLARRDQARLAHGPVVERLIEPARSSGLTVAAIQIEDPRRKQTWLYARTKGLWRCREAWGAPADVTAIQALIASFVEAQGVVRTSDPARAAAYGLDAEHALRVSFHGPKLLEAPDHDLLFAFDVGVQLARPEAQLSSSAAQPSSSAAQLAPNTAHARGNERAFVRARGTTRVLEIDRNPAPLIEVAADVQAPLLDLRWLAYSTAAGFKGFKQMFIDRESGTDLVLTLAAGATSDGAAAWTLEYENQEVPCPGWRVGGLTAMLLRGRYSSLEDPARQKELGLEPPVVRFTLVPIEGEPIELAIGKPDHRGEACVFNKTLRVVGHIPASVQAQFVVDPPMLLDMTRPNPWEDWLRR